MLSTLHVARYRLMYIIVKNCETLLTIYVSLQLLISKPTKKKTWSSTKCKNSYWSLEGRFIRHNMCNVSFNRYLSVIAKEFPAPPFRQTRTADFSLYQVCSTFCKLAKYNSDGRKRLVFSTVAFSEYIFNWQIMWSHTCGHSPVEVQFSEKL